MSRLIDADELMEHVGRDRLDTREAIMEMINNAPTVLDIEENEEILEELKAAIEWHSRTNERLKAQVHALAFALRCSGVSGGEVKYEAY